MLIKASYIASLMFMCTTPLMAEAVDSPFKTDCEDCVPMQIVPAGSFEMGGWINYGYGDMDGPKHTVTFANSFAVAEREVTIAEFRKFTKATGYVSENKCNIYTDTETWHVAEGVNWERPGFPQEENHPVVCVSYEDIQAYISWLNGVTGNSYRMMSEAEWEYVAATGGLGSGEDGSFVHNDGNIGKEECCGGETGGRDKWIYTAPPASFPADKYGLYDIRGNVWELQADCHKADYLGAPVDGSPRTECPEPGHRSVRGGSYGDASQYLTPTFRLPGIETQGYFTVGFRLAHSMPTK